MPSKAKIYRIVAKFHGTANNCINVLADVFGE